MIQELIYTSAPQGLRPGSSGFCTVATTPNLASNFVQRLESLSGYSHVEGAVDAGSAGSPVVSSHLQLTVAGKRYHLLSRIADSGSDYSGRSNKLAHHVLLDEAELVPGGPAHLLLRPGFMEDDWQGSPRILPAGRSLPTDSPSLAVCHAWQRLAGDAGWAGVLAESVLKPATRQAVIVFRPGMDVLPLVDEALRLLPPVQRWTVTFSTYYTKLPPGVDCDWRFVLQNTPEARLAQRTPRGPVIDLCRSLSAAEGGMLVRAARDGVMPRPAKAAPMVPPTPKTSGASPAGESHVRPEQLSSLEEDDDFFQVLDDALYRRTDETATPQRPPRAPVHFDAAAESRRAKRTALFAASGAFALVVLLGAVFALTRDSSSETGKTPEDSHGEARDTTSNAAHGEGLPVKDEPLVGHVRRESSGSNPDRRLPRRPRDPSLDHLFNIDGPADSVGEASTASSTESQRDEHSEQESTHDAESHANPSESERNPKPDVPSRRDPWRDVGDSFTLPYPPGESASLCTLDIESDDTVGLELLGGERLKENPLSLTQNNSAGAGLVTWDVSWKHATGYEMRAAVFSLAEGTLAFAWEKKQMETSEAKSLRHYVLRVTAGDQARVFGLKEVDEIAVRVEQEADYFLQHSFDATVFTLHADVETAIVIEHLTADPLRLEAICQEGKKVRHNTDPFVIELPGAKLGHCVLELDGMGGNQVDPQLVVRLGLFVKGANGRQLSLPQYLGAAKQIIATADKELAEVGEKIEAIENEIKGLRKKVKTAEGELESVHNSVVEASKSKEKGPQKLRNESVRERKRKAAERTKRDALDAIKEKEKERGPLAAEKGELQRKRDVAAQAIADAEGKRVEIFQALSVQGTLSAVYSTNSKKQVAPLVRFKTH